MSHCDSGRFPQSEHRRSQCLIEYIRMYWKCPITLMAMSSLICVVLNCRCFKFLVKNFALENYNQNSSRVTAGNEKKDCALSCLAGRDGLVL